jgi:hypothetical protein
MFWLKWIDAFGRTHYRSSGSHDRDVAENMLRDELKRKADGLSASPDPRRTLVNDLLEALKNRYRVEGRRSWSDWKMPSSTFFECFAACPRRT